MVRASAAHVLPSLSYSHETVPEVCVQFRLPRTSSNKSSWHSGDGRTLAFLSPGQPMDHKEQHHEHHRKEREHELKEKKAHERDDSERGLPFHPAWFVVVGVVLVSLVVGVWLFLTIP
jgi:hypothetical protein